MLKKISQIKGSVLISKKQQRTISGGYHESDVKCRRIPCSNHTDCMDLPQGTCNWEFFECVYLNCGL